MKGIMFVGNIGISKNRPGRRVDENFLEAVTAKMMKIREIAAQQNLQVIFLGNILRKRFEAEAYTSALRALKGLEAVSILGATEYLGAGVSINEFSPAMLLEHSEIIHVARHDEKPLELTIDDEKVRIHFNVERLATPDLDRKEGCVEILAMRSGLLDLNESEEVISNMQEYDFTFVNSCTTDIGISTSSNHTLVHTGPLVRDKLYMDGHNPVVWIYRKGGDISSLEIESQKFVFDTTGFDYESELGGNSSEDSEFAKLLKAKSIVGEEEVLGSDFIMSEFKDITSTEVFNAESIDIVQNLIKKTSNTI